MELGFNVFLHVVIMAASLTVTSYNLTGFKQIAKQDYIRVVSSRVSAHIILLQEAWLLESESAVIDSALPGYCTVSKSGMDIIYGRPYGGVAVCWQDSLSPCVTKVATQSRRICAISLKTDIDVLIINCYMPCDSRSYHIDNEFEECLNEMYMLVNSYQDKAIVIGGDFNVDISRNTGHTLLLQQFCLDLSLHFMWDHSKVNSSFIYERFDGSARGVSRIFERGGVQYLLVP